MRRLLEALFLAAGMLAAALIAKADDIPLELQGDVTKVQVDVVVVTKQDRTLVKSLPFRIKAKEGEGFYFWQFPKTVEALDMGNVLEVTSAPKGALTIGVKRWYADFDKKKYITEFGKITFDVGEVIPPTPPVPPKPPDPPPPPPNPAPLTDVGMRVMVIYESAQSTPELQNLLGGEATRTFLNLITVKDESGKAAWRFYDKDVNVANEAKWVREAMARPRTGLPWLIVSNAPKGGSEGPIPQSMKAADLIQLIKKYE